MLRKSSSIILLGLLVALCFLMVVGGSVSAGNATPAPTPIPNAPHISDGRVNAYDVAAPVAVFCKMTYPDRNNTSLKVVNRFNAVLDRVELWGVTDSTRQFHEIAMVPGSTINATPGTLGVHVDAEGYGYALYHNADGSLTVVAPPDQNGFVYRFTWMPNKYPNC
ncbi:MAG: hypothetical protein U0452_12410 [Anaerolineae bacterium]